MKTLSIDIETYSDVNLAKCGVYKYAFSPSFEILLFGYSFDGNEVQVIDLAQGEHLPQELIDALTDDSVTKWAFNANFERVCLSRYLSNIGISLDPFHDNHTLSKECARFLNPESWRCSMVWAATMGLPLSLEGVGTVLGLEKQKLSEGKELIKYFSVPCTPTKTNGGRTRNLPADAQDKWETFKRYNLRDVETEMGIKARLSKFPVPESVWDEYNIDQEINDRGVRLDMDLVQKAIEMDTRSRTELTAAMKKLTALDNPNSVQQMKQWLSENGLETDTLGKKAVAELLKTASPELQTVLTLRQQLAKSSVGNTRRWNAPHAMTAERTAALLFTEPTAQAAGQAD
jgi:DNA polymerase